MTDLAIQLGQILVYASVTCLLALAGHCLLQGVREARAWGRLDRRIGEIGRDQVAGKIERLSAADVRERGEGR